MADNSHIPETIMQFWRDSPTEYSKEDIHHLEPDSEEAVFLKYLLENGFATLTIKLNGKALGSFNGQKETDVDVSLGTLTIQRNGETVGTYNGSEPKNIDINLGTLTIQKNGSTVETYNGDSSRTVNITVPTITYGTGNPSGGNSGDVYMRYL
ncbi:MAG: hypothetical protein ACI4PR_01805 [Acutalibacteraceae bacterium]